MGRAPDIQGTGMLNPVILAEPSRPAEGGTTGFGGNPEERAVLPSSSVAVITGLRPSFPLP